MTTYSNKPLAFFALFTACFRNFGSVFKNTWYLVLLAGICSYLGGGLMNWNLYIGGVMTVFFLFAIIFLYAVILSQGNTALEGKQPVLKESIKNAKRKYIKILGGNVIIMLIFLLLGVVNFGVLQLGGVLGVKFLLFIPALLFSIFVIFVIYFAIPVLVIKNLTVLGSFERSVKLAFVNGWRVFAVLLLIHIVLLFIFMLGLVLIQSRNLLVLQTWVSIVQFLIYPFLVTALLTLIRDSELRLAIKH